MGNDMILAALPGRAVQLAHAILAAGYDLAVPVSWGEELLAEYVLREFEQPAASTLVFCACPMVRKRMLASGTGIVPHLLSTVSPPVATARYLRALQPDVAMRITFLGACPGAVDHSIDAHLHPGEFLRLLAGRGIVITDQPMVFESLVPPDRRRHWSIPGGAPSADALLTRGVSSRVVTTDAEIALDIAEHIFAGDRILLDLAAMQGCVCAGVVEVQRAEGGRAALVALEPPRSSLPVVDVEPRVPLTFPLAHPAVNVSLRVVRAASASHAQSADLTPIHDASRGRAAQRRMAITPSRISHFDPRARSPKAEATQRASAPPDAGTPA